MPGPTGIFLIILQIVFTGPSIGKVFHILCFGPSL